ncbi:16421_t:CDS:2, partial [Acaulospora morrowiae]
MFAANDSETEIYYASESLPDLDSELEENTMQDEDIEATSDAEDLSISRHYTDFNTTNMDLDGEYTSEDEERRPRVSAAYGIFQRLGVPYTARHHRRSSSQRIRGFSPLSSRVSLRRSNAITPSFLSQRVKHNSELGSKTINGVGSKELGQFHLPESSFLRAGMTFKGTQNLMNTQPSQSNEEWEVKVTVHYVNYKTGTVIGLMEALNVPSSSNTVVTYWEGEMIDFVNHSLWTDKWNSTPEIDLQHWKKFDAFRHMDVRSILRGTSREWFQEACQKYIFMRWKEHYFVNVTAQESGLTIAGFYYICIRRSDGAIEGYYFDPVSTPYQKLTLKPLLEGNGVSF